jgi:hypothetical protein
MGDAQPLGDLTVGGPGGCSCTSTMSRPKPPRKANTGPSRSPPIAIQARVATAAGAASIASVDRRAVAGCGPVTRRIRTTVPSTSQHSRPSPNHHRQAALPDRGRRQCRDQPRGHGRKEPPGVNLFRLCGTGDPVAGEPHPEQHGQAGVDVDQHTPGARGARTTQRQAWVSARPTDARAGPPVCEISPQSPTSGRSAPM